MVTIATAKNTSIVSLFTRVLYFPRKLEAECTWTHGVERRYGEYWMLWILARCTRITCTRTSRRIFYIFQWGRRIRCDDSSYFYYHDMPARKSLSLHLPAPVCVCVCAQYFRHSPIGEPQAAVGTHSIWGEVICAKLQSMYIAIDVYCNRENSSNNDGHW